MKKVAGKLRLELAQYRELAAFAQFASDLDAQTQKTLERGSRLTEVLKQGWEDPVAVENQVVIIWAATNGYLDKVKKDFVKEWETRFLQYIEASDPEILDTLRKKKELASQTEEKLKKACETFNDINTQLQIEEEE